MLYIKPNSRSYSNTKWTINKTVIDKLINISINRLTLTPDKRETTTATSRPTSITQEILIIKQIDHPTTTPT